MIAGGFIMPSEQIEVAARDKPAMFQRILFSQPLMRNPVAIVPAYIVEQLPQIINIFAI